MTDTEFEDQCERVESLIKSLIPTMGLVNYAIHVAMVPGLIDGQHAVMAVTSDWRYEQATIEASIDLCAEETDEQLTYTVLHEGAHCHLALMRADEPTPEQRDREELAATRIGRMGLACLKRGYEQGCERSTAELDELTKENIALKRKLKKLEKKAA
jgi:hypothetical protein